MSTRRKLLYFLTLTLKFYIFYFEETIGCRSFWSNHPTFFSRAEFQPLYTYCWSEIRLCKRYSSYKLDAVIPGMQNLLHDFSDKFLLLQQVYLSP